MKIGDLVQVNKLAVRYDARDVGLWYKTGVVLGRERRYEPGKSPLVRVFMENRERLFDYCSLDVINESR
jgi:hypothetical protein